MKPGLKNPLMRVTNLLLYLAFCGLIGTGALLHWKLIPGSEGGRGLTTLGMTRHQWADLHFYLAVICAGTAFFHLFLNRAWLKKIASSGKAWRLIAGLLVGAALIFGIYALPVSKKAPSQGDTVEEEGHAHRRGR